MGNATCRDQSRAVQSIPKISETTKNLDSGRDLEQTQCNQALSRESPKSSGAKRRPYDL